MSKYIDSEALKRDLIDNRNFYPAIVANAIEHAPACDVVEVVRCKDCVYSYFVSQYSKYECSRWGILLFSNDFCSFGERKED